MLPEDFIQRISSQNYIDSGSLVHALGEPSPVSIRLNRSKWKRVPQEAENVPWCANGYYLRTRPSYTSDPLFHSGCYYPQEASGMFLEQVVLQTAESLKNIRVLDLCGAPGGKSSLLSDMIGPDNLLVANEVIRSRAGILAETVTKWGTGNTLVTQSDPSAFGRLQGFFDIILVDAPCSGEGMFRTDVAVSEWSAGNTALCSERQKRILMDIWPCLKENGVLIYSTCTFNPGENEENVKWLTEKNDADCIRLDIKKFDGITEIEYKGIYGYGFHPGRIRGEGFFVSAIRKRSVQAGAHIKNQTMADLKPGRSDLQMASEMSEFNMDSIIRWGDEIIALPCTSEIYNYLYRNLKVVKAGTKIAVVKGNDGLPSHDIALSSRLKREAFPVHEVTDYEAIAFLRRDNLSFTGLPKGWNIVTYNDVVLGFLKNLGNRVNNYFPVEWRIRLDPSAIRSSDTISWL